MKRLLAMGSVTTALLATFACASGRGRVTHEAIDQMMRDYDGQIPGASVAVISRGRTIFSKSYGLANLETRQLATSKSNYRLASVTKQFTATAIMILEEQGKLEYDDSARQFLPSLPEALSPVTLRHLLSHTSGIIDYEDLIPEARVEQIHDADVLRLLESEHRLNFRPGSSYRYSNSGYALLALIVEKASGRSFATFLREEIFLPAGMQATVAFEEGISRVDRRAFGYSRKDGGFEQTDQSVTSAVLGDGGIYSSVEDLARWDRALEKATLVRAESLRLSWTPATDTDVSGVRYGFGWRISSHRGHETLWHSGETRGFRNVIVRFPGHRLTVIILTNRNEAPPHGLALRIADQFLSQ
ncbi:MAG TPA: serine hydrolase domain-containing protein [Thermoanaerobaculia bacterium]|nr:serine hydrolase domain-containing protein [Thermoanaerobaculia bacterium]